MILDKNETTAQQVLTHTTKLWAWPESFTVLEFSNRTYIVDLLKVHRGRLVVYLGYSWDGLFETEI